MCSLPFKNNKILVSNRPNSTDNFDMNSTSKGKAVTVGGYFSDISRVSLVWFIALCFFPRWIFCWTMIVSAVRSKNTLLKDTDLGAVHLTAPWKMRCQAEFFSELTGCSVFAVLSPWWDTCFSWRFMQSWSQAGLHCGSCALLLAGGRGGNSDLAHFHLWLAFPLQDSGSRNTSDRSVVRTNVPSKY